jgi:hypothetical protein
MEEFREAQEAGFESYELYQAHRSAQAQEEIERGLRAKFGQVKRKIIENGEVIRNPKNNQLIIASDGKLYAISSADEYWMLHCAAKVL